MAANFRLGFAGAPHPDNVARDLQIRACNLANGDLYLYPNRSTPALDATKPITFTWATDCAMSTSVDIYLYAPSSANGIVQKWPGITYSEGKYTTQLPNSNVTTVSMYILMVDAGTPSFAGGTPGPVFTVDYPSSAVGTTTSNGQTITTTAAGAAQSTNAVFENVNSTQGKHISKGGIAAAVIVPILVLAALIAVAVRFWRQREAEKRKKWSRAMSSHSNLEWEKGAMPGDRPQSILGRPSFGSQHPGMRAASVAGSSIYATENLAGAGAGMVRPAMAHFSQSADNLHQQRASLMLPEGNHRQSRISFAEAARPTRESRASIGGDIRPSSFFKLPHGSRSATELQTPNKPKQAAYASGSAIVDDEDDDINISPSQLQGPNAFADAEMRRVGGNKSRTGRKSLLSLGGSRRESVVSHLSADDFRSAASARGSTDELRDLEATIMARRSFLSQHSGAHSSPDLHNSPNPGQWSHPNSPYLQQDSNAAETLSQDTAPSTLPTAGSTSTVAYGPDQMLAVYAARAKGNAPSAPAPAAAPASKKQGIRILTGLGKKNNDDSAPLSASEMKSYVHLNQGTASSAAVEALPLPGPNFGRSRSGTVSRSGSEDEDIGQAK